jgi:hypothetical protein
MSPDDAAIRQAILAVLAERTTGATACPSEAARRLDPGNWRALMPDVRRVAAALVREGRIGITQRGLAVDPETARGPVRLGPPAQ